MDETKKESSACQAQGSAAEQQATEAEATPAGEATGEQMPKTTQAPADEAVGETLATDAGAAEPEPQEVEQPPLEDQVSELRDRLLRAMAELENTRKRAQRDREEANKYAITGFARSVLTVADNLRRAIDSVPDEERDNEALKTLIAGVEMTERELLKAFEQQGIQAVEPLGEKFDHNFHQAMFEVEGSGQPPGTIVQVMEAGYVIADRLLRPAMVGIAKGDPGDQSDDASSHIDTKV